MKVIILDHNNNQEVAEALRLACVDMSIGFEDNSHIDNLIEFENNIYNELFKLIDEPFYKYNYHDQFRDFEINKKYMFKTIRIRRKR